MSIKWLWVLPLLLLTGCIKPDPVRLVQQSARQDQAVEKMAYVADRALWLTTLGSTDQQKIDTCPPQPAYCWFTHLRWSPDGKYLLYLKDNDSTSTLHFTDRNGKTRIVPGAGENQLGLPIPVWSADGQRLIYVADGLRQMQAPFTEAGNLGSPPGDWFGAGRVARHTPDR